VPVTYNTIEPISGSSFPSWNTWWPADSGCGPIFVHDVEGGTEPPVGETIWYEPESVSSWKTRGISGRSHTHPPFTHTPYSISKVTTRLNLLKREQGQNGIVAYRQYGRVTNTGSQCVPTLLRTEQIGPLFPKWREVTHQFVGLNYLINQIDEADVVKAIASVQSELEAEALTQYDALTDIAQLGDLPALVRDVSGGLYSIIRSLMGRYNINDMRFAASLPIWQLLKHPKKALRQLGGAWMKYRYAIMPLLYSYHDAVKAMARGKDVTTRKTAWVMPTDLKTHLPPSNMNYSYTETVGGVFIRGCYYQHFSMEAIAQMAGVGFNPFVTAWELIPYSFVIDWFVNIGDFITRSTTHSLAQVRYASISRRNSYLTRTYVHYPNESHPVSVALRWCTPWVGPVPPFSPSQTISRPEESQLWKTVEVNEYSRWPVSVGDAQLSFNPSLNWRRLVDSAVMANNRLGRLMRSLK